MGRHVKKCLPQFTCSQCHKQLRSEKGLTRHIIDTHWVKCRVCEEKTDRISLALCNMCHKFVSSGVSTFCVAAMRMGLQVPRGVKSILHAMCRQNLAGVDLLRLARRHRTQQHAAWKRDMLTSALEERVNSSFSVSLLPLSHTVEPDVAEPDELQNNIRDLFELLRRRLGDEHLRAVLEVLRIITPVKRPT